MANTVTSFYQTLVAAAAEACQVLVANLKVVDSVYLDYDPSVTADIGQTLNVAIPASRTAGVTDIGAGDLVLTDVSATTKPIVFNKHPSDGLIIRDFEQFNTPEMLRTVFLDSAIKGVKESINATVAALFTTANFAVNTAIATTTGLVSTTQFLQGLAILSDQKVPVTDAAMMSLLVGSVPYTKILNDSNWTSAQIASDRRADVIRSSGEMPSAYGATVKLDQQMPVSGSAPTRTFTAAYCHKWAVAVATRRLPAPDPKVTDFFYIDFAGIPILVTLSYQHLKKGWVLSVEAGYGAAVVRPEMCQLFTVAE